MDLDSGSCGETLADASPEGVTAREAVVDVVVAREAELARLEAMAGSAFESSGTACFLSGEAGAGKSTLAAEFVRRLQARDDRVLVAKGQCNAFTGLTDAYLPLREALATLAGYEGSVLGGDENRRRLNRGAGFCLELVAEVGPGLVGLFIPPAAVALNGARWVKKRLAAEKDAASNSTLDQSRLFEQFTAVVEGILRRSQLILALEDLHWCDAASLALIFHLLRELQRPGLLVMGTYRPEEVDAGRDGERHPFAKVLTELTRYQGDVVIEVGSDAESGRAFVDAYLDTEPNELGDAFRSALTALTDGQALFTTEIVRSMKADGRLVQTPTGWVEGRSLDWSLVPARVDGVIQERIERLSTAERLVLGAAAVQGVRFVAEVTARSSGLDDTDVIRVLSRDLDRRHGLVSELGESRVGATNAIEYEFAHALIQGWVYDDLSLAERRQLHGAAAAAIETMAGDEREVVLGTLGHHYELAGDVERARTCWLQAGERASGLWLWEEGRLALGPRAPAHSRCARKSASELLWLYGQQCVNAERLAEGRAAMSEGRELAEGIGEPVLASMHHSLSLFAGAWQEGGDAYVDEAYEAVVEADRTDDIAARALARSVLGDVLRIANRPSEAIQANQEAVDALAGTADFPPDWRAICLMNLAESLAFSGQADDAVRVYSEQVDVSRSLNSKRAQAEAALGTVFIRLAQGDVASARDGLDALVLQHGEFPAQPAFRARIETMAGFISLSVGDVDAASAALRRALSMYLQFEALNPFTWTAPLVGLAEIAAASGGWVRAAELLGATHGKLYPAPLDFYNRRASAAPRPTGAYGRVDAELRAAYERGRGPAYRDVLEEIVAGTP